MCALCSTAVIRRPSIDVTGARCAVRAWGVLFGVRVARSLAPEPGARLLFSLIARVCSKKKRAHTQSTRCCSLQSTRRCLHPANPPQHDFTGLGDGLALAWLRHTGHAFGESLVWRKPSAMRACLLLAAALRCAYVRDVDNAGFLLMRCAHLPGTTRALLAKIIVPFRTQKNEPNHKQNGRYGHVRPIYEAVFWKLIFSKGSGEWTSTKPCHNLKFANTMYTV